MTRCRAGTNPYRIYWVTWASCSSITVAMLAAEKFHMPRWFLVVFLLAFMMVKAVMIGGNFMHLRFEKPNLALMVAVGHPRHVADPVGLFLPRDVERARQDARDEPGRCRAAALWPRRSPGRAARQPPSARCAAPTSRPPTEARRTAGELNRAILLMFLAPYAVFGYLRDRPLQAPDPGIRASAVRAARLRAPAAAPAGSRALQNPSIARLAFSLPAVNAYAERDERGAAARRLRRDPLRPPRPPRPPDAVRLRLSTLFLASYLVYHFNVGSVRFQRPGPDPHRVLCDPVEPHLLAAAIVPLVSVTLGAPWTVASTPTAGSRGRRCRSGPTSRSPAS